MSSNTRTEYALGLCVVALVAGLLTFTGLSNRPVEDTPTDQLIIKAKFGQIDGVAEGSAVRFAGMPIGEVQTVTLLPDYSVELSLAVNPDVEIPTDSAALIETDGLFGAKYIEIQPGGELDTVVSGGRLSFTQDSVILEELVAKIIDQAKAERGIVDEN